MSDVRAMVLTAPNQIELQRFPKPDIGEDDALLRIEASGICGTDYESLSGEYARSYPVILGHEPLGTIELSAWAEGESSPAWPRFWVPTSSAVRRDVCPVCSTEFAARSFPSCAPRIWPTRFSMVSINLSATTIPRRY